jgi:hypothetical protein
MQYVVGIDVIMKQAKKGSGNSAELQREAVTCLPIGSE